VHTAAPLIAVVDDDESMREAVAGLMRAVGFSVEAFSRAEDFLNSRQAVLAACLVADINMPGMSGLDLHRNNIPTILVTAYPSDAARSRALAAGVLCYLTKPFMDDDLLACINSALNGTGSG
jgi:FixJ family two-component response regulator